MASLGVYGGMSLKKFYKIAPAYKGYNFTFTPFDSFCMRSRAVTTKM